MKVLCFMNHADQGGAALAFIELIEGIQKNYGVECVVYTGKKNKINNRCVQLKIENYVAPFKNFISSKRNPEFIWKKVVWIRNIIGDALAMKQIPNRIDLNSIDLIYTNLDRIDIGAKLSKKYNKPHVWHIREHLDTDFKIVSAYEDYAKYMDSFDSYYVAISHSVKNAWIKRGLPIDKLKLIYDGVNIQQIRIKNKWFINGKVHFLFLGGYCDEKGQKIFIESLQNLSTPIRNKVDITFYGSGLGTMKQKLRNAAFKAGVSDIVIFNEYNPNIYDLIGSYDIGVNYSLEEGFGRVTVEYMAAGLCPLVTNSGANKELIKHEITGLQVTRGDSNQLCRCIKYIVENKEKIREIGMYANKQATDFSMSVHIKKMRDLFYECCR